MQRVLMLDKNKEPLMPCRPAKARRLLRKGKAAVFRRFPFTIILKGREGGEVQDIAVKLDPGSKTTGLAVVADFKQRGPVVVFAANLEHKGHKISEALTSRRSLRRSRRNRHCRYRPPRFLNRRRKPGCLPPSLQARVDNTLSLVSKLRRLTPVQRLDLEAVRFDTQKLVNPEIEGIEYQQGELFGYELREYLLEKWKRCCAYCGKKDVPLEIEHLIARSLGGSNCVTNLTIACRSCNQKKGNKQLADFVKDPVKLKRLSDLAKSKSLRNAAAVNASRMAIARSLEALGLPLDSWSGGRTKFNRVRQNYPKDHWIDAACVGITGEKVEIPDSLAPLLIKACGRGSRQMCRMDRYGFPRTSAKAARTVKTFRTGDLVSADVAKGKHLGHHSGRVAIRNSGYFNISKAKQVVQGISYRACRMLQRADGYNYEFTRRAAPPRHK